MLRQLAAAGLAALLAPATVCAQAGAADLHGFVMESFAGFRFTRCGSSAPLSLVDQTPQQALSKAIGAVRPVMSSQDRPIYVELRGVLGARSLTAVQLQRVVGYVADCKSLPTDVPAGARLAAVGVGDPWSFTLTPSGAVFSHLGSRPLRFAAAAFARPSVTEGASRTFDAWSQADGGTIRIEFAEALCLNLNAESAFGARVTGRVGSHTLDGCASRF